MRRNLVFGSQRIGETVGRSGSVRDAHDAIAAMQVRSRASKCDVSIMDYTVFSPIHDETTEKKRPTNFAGSMDRFRGIKKNIGIDGLSADETRRREENGRNKIC